MLLAPEVSEAGAATLLLDCSVRTIFHDQKHGQKATKLVQFMSEHSSFGFKTVKIPACKDGEHYGRVSPLKDCSTSDVAYIHHTSGTSSGTPKPIPITHRGAVGVLPSLSDTGITFTTTPLFHGGPADAFRAWTSGAAIVFFPGLEAQPITPDNVLGAIAAVQLHLCHYPETKLSYFTSVPYILEALSNKDDGVQILQSMDLVGVGGAALPQSVGDKLAKHQNVRLISRYGSAECGFIMSSRRDYSKDTDWDYLESYDFAGMRFHPQGDGTAELELADWPFMAVTNTSKHTFKTGDCFRSHRSTINRWKYTGRNDAQLTLTMGLKFDPSPVEDTILESIRFQGTIREVYVFGNQRNRPGVLLFRSPSNDLQDAEVLDQIWPIVETTNQKAAPYARISRDMLVVMPHDSEAIPKSSKGTFLRRQADEVFEREIADVYDRRQPIRDQQPLDLQKLAANVYRIVKERMIGSAPGTVPDEEDLFKIGADSTVCLQIRDQLQRDYGQILEHEFPASIVYDCGTIKKLIKHIHELYLGTGSTKYVEGQVEQMERMVAQFGYMHMPVGSNGR